MTKLKRPMVTIHNITTNEIINREMTDDEFAQYEIDKAAHLIAKAEAEAKENAKAELLARLGISAEEAALLLS